MAAEPAQSFRVKNTFIDVEEDEESEMATERRARYPRHKTAPNQTPYDPDAEDDDNEEDAEGPAERQQFEQAPIAQLGCQDAVAFTGSCEPVRIKNTFIEVDDTTPDVREVRAAGRNRNRTEPCHMPLPEDLEDDGVQGMANEQTTSPRDVPTPASMEMFGSPTPEGPTPCWVGTGIAGLSPSPGGPVPVKVKNTFIDVDDEESPALRQARHPRHKTVPASSNMGVDLDELEEYDGTPVSVSKTDIHDGQDKTHIMTTQTGSGVDLEENDGDIDLSMVRVTSLTVPRMQVNALTQSQVDGYCRTEWVVDARKVKGTDKQIVSPPFDVTPWPAAPSLSFRITLVPKNTSSKGGVSFKKSEGVGHVQVKCHTDEEELETLGDASIRVMVGSVQDDPRGPFEHNFYDNLVFNLPRNQADWDFNALSDSARLALLVCLDIGPP